MPRWLGSKTTNDKRLPIRILEHDYETLKAYSDIVHKPITKVISEMVRDWMEAVGAKRIAQAKTDETAQLDPPS